MAKENQIVGNHKGPQSIDFDQDSNLYFTDAMERALFKITRNEDGTPGKGKALFVPTIRGGGKILEIPHIQELIQPQ
jgi:hypothetical protein